MWFEHSSILLTGWSNVYMDGSCILACSLYTLTYNNWINNLAMHARVVYIPRLFDSRFSVQPSSLALQFLHTLWKIWEMTLTLDTFSPKGQVWLFLRTHCCMFSLYNTDIVTVSWNSVSGRIYQRALCPVTAVVNGDASRDVYMHHTLCGYMYSIDVAM